MTRMSTKAGPRPNEPVAAPLPTALTPQREPQQEHPHRNFDRAARGAIAKLSGGVSTHSFIEAWSDWTQHLVRSPGRQMELAEHAVQNVLKLAALTSGSSATPPFAPKSYDHRFDHPAWQDPPFQMWQQGFLALQDWWDHATEPMRGLRREDAERTRFLARQMLDLASPSNFPLLNPEIIAETLRTGGRNLAEGPPTSDMTC